MFGLLAWFCGRAILLGDMFAFRDAANYYQPLFQWECQQWRAGQIPLWNPLDNCGTPALADTSSSVLYPGKLLFALPIDFQRRFNLYVALHLVLAGVSAFSLARQFRGSVPAAGLCGLSYAFGGSVLFQYANVIYLVGAAWLPLALLATDRMLRRRRPVWAIALGGILALMTLGGDPQTAYHALLMAGFYALLLAWRRHAPARKGPFRFWLRRGRRSATSLGPAHRAPPRSQTVASKPSGAKWPFSVRIARNPFVLLGLAAVTGAGFAAVQILPARQWTRHSDRVVYRFPRNVYEATHHLLASDGVAARDERDPWSDVLAGWFGRPPGDTHHGSVYQFSLTPWRSVEFVWPNITGRVFPTHRRWISLIPAEGRTWNPSLYFGLLPFLFAVRGFLTGGKPPYASWIAWSAVVALLGSFGWYGPGWLLHELRVNVWGAAADKAVVAQPVGGIYWWLFTLLPGYAYFRYPSKLLTVAALCLSLLAARGWDATLAPNAGKGGRTRLAKLSLLLVILSFGGLLMTEGSSGIWKPLFHNAPADAVFGPLDVAGAAGDIRTAFLHTAAVGLIFFGLVRWLWPRRPQLACGLVLLLTVFDLAIANAWMVATLPANLWGQPQVWAKPLRGDESHFTDDSLARTHRVSMHQWLPAEWQQRTSPDRLRQAVTWERESMLPKYHLLGNVALVESFSSLKSSDYAAMLRTARSRQPSQGLDADLLAALSTRYLIGPETTDPDGRWRRVDIETAHRGITLWEDRHARRNAWIVHRVEFVEPLSTRRWQPMMQRTQEVFYPDGQLRDLQASAVIEAAGSASTTAIAPPPIDGGEECRVTHRSSTRLEVEVALTSPGLVVMNDLYYPGWIARVTSGDGSSSRALPVERVNRVMRGVILDAGRHRLVLEYRPLSFYVGAAISIACWLVLPTLCWVCRRKRR
jgi:hypothetical protein